MSGQTCFYLSVSKTESPKRYQQSSLG